jgi:hypothetical protein
MSFVEDNPDFLAVVAYQTATRLEKMDYIHLKYDSSGYFFIICIFPNNHHSMIDSLVFSQSHFIHNAKPIGQLWQLLYWI